MEKGCQLDNPEIILRRCCSPHILSKQIQECSLVECTIFIAAAYFSCRRISLICDVRAQRACTRFMMGHSTATIVQWTCSAVVLFKAIMCLEAAALCNSLPESPVLRLQVYSIVLGLHVCKILPCAQGEAHAGGASSSDEGLAGSPLSLAWVVT